MTDKILTVLVVLMLIVSPALVRAGDRVVARVGSTPITYLEVREAQSEGQGMPFDEALQLIIEQKLALAWARDNQVYVSNEEVDDIINSLRESNNLTEEQFEQALIQQGMTPESFRKRIHEQVTSSRAVSMAIGQRIQLNEETLQNMYEQEYKSRQSYTLRHVFFKVDDDMDEDERTRIFEEAEILLDDIRAGMPFEQAARERSDDTTTANRGGDLGTFSKGELLPELDAVAIQLEPGDVDGPIETSAGYHIIQVTSKELIPPPPLEDVREDLVRKWMEEKRMSEVKKWMTELQEIYYVEIFPDDG
jgi:parvulin-like peptidyl-prolyl isomerase